MKINRGINLLIFLSTWIIWFISLNLIISVSERKTLYDHPNVRVQLSEPVFALSNAEGINNGSFEWVKVENAFVVNRYEDTVELIKDYPAYIDVNKTEIIDTQAGSQLVLPKNKVIELLTDICDGKAEQYDLKFELDSDSGVVSNNVIDLPDEFKINMTGRYEGFILVNTRRQTVPIKDTSFEQTNDATTSILYRTILICLIGSVIAAMIITVCGVMMARKAENKKLLVVIPGVSSFLVLAISIFCFFTLKMH